MNSRRSVRRAILGAWLTAVLAAACAPAGAPSPLADGQESPEAVVRSVLQATGARDTAGLRALMITRDEYRTLLWPLMPDSAYTPFDFVWSLNAANSRKGLRELLGTFGGTELELVSLRFDEEPEVHDHFAFHRGARVTVRRKDTGQEGILPTFDVFVEYGGAWKLMNFEEL